MSDVGYALEALHVNSPGQIVSIAIAEDEAKEIIRRLWPEKKIWGAPGGRSFGVETQAEVDEINRILKGRHIAFNPEKHSWHFHVYLL
jgi:hypothetical protein